MVTLQEFSQRHPALIKAALLAAALVAVSLPALQPLMVGALPRTDDALQHLYRLVALDSAIRQGDLWPRYVSTLVYGYGEPLFNFYAPTSLYLPELLHLVGLRFQDALLASLVLYTLIGVGGAYLLGEVWGGPAMGLGAAAATGYAPYLLHNLLERGAVGEIAGLALLPWVLWAFHRLAERRQRREFVIAVVLLALMLLMHNITAVQGVALLVVYCAFLWWTGDHPPRIFVHLGLAGVLAIGLAAFFWLPALAETPYVQLDKAAVGVNNPPGSPEFYDQFQPLDATFATPHPADLTWFNPPVQRTLAWSSVVLAALGLGMVLSAKSANRQEQLFKRLMIVAVVLLIGLVFMTTQASAPVWAAVPLLRYFQFPWRMLGPASILLALMAGGGMLVVGRMLTRRGTQTAWLGLCLIVTILYSMPWLYQLYIPDPAASSVVDAQNYERETGRLGGTARGEYVPIWVKELPGSDRLKGLYLKGDVIPRLQPLNVVTVRSQQWASTSARLELTSTEDTVLTFDWLYFPGWWARIDDKEAPVKASEPNGLVTVAVPQGDHVVELGFGPTPIRLGASIASGVFLALTIAALFVFPNRLWQPAPAPKPSASWQEAFPAAATAALIGIVLFGLKGIFFDHYSTPIKHERFAEGIEQGVRHPVWAVFGGQVTLLGYDLDHPAIQSGQSEKISMIWQPTDAVIPEDYSSTLYVRDAVGNIVFQTGSFYPGGWATSTWVPGFWVDETLNLNIPPGTPPGQYALEASLYSSIGGKALAALDAQGQPSGELVRIGQLTVTRPNAPARMSDLSDKDRKALDEINAPLSDAIRLLAISPLPTSGEVGQPLPLVTYWQASTAQDDLLNFELVWVDALGTEAAVSPGQVPVVGYGTDQWQPGDVWRGLHVMHIPGRLMAGAYTTQIRLADAQGDPVGEPIELGQVVVSAPPRSFARPRPNVRTDEQWTNGIKLVGYDLFGALVRRGDAAKLNLYWQANNELDASLTVFVHITDAAGNIVGQVDSIPGGGSRPTTGWAPGEYLTDYYQVIIRKDTPPGQYFIRVGWYIPETGQRIPINGPNVDFWLMPVTLRVP